MKNLKSVTVGKEEVTSIIGKTGLEEILDEISKVNKFEWFINYSTELQYLDKCALFFPPACRYSIVEYYEPKNWSELSSQLNSELKDKWLNDIVYLKVSWIYLCFTLSPEDYSFIIN